MYIMAKKSICEQILSRVIPSDPGPGCVQNESVRARGGLQAFAPGKPIKSPAGWGTGNPAVAGHNPLAAVPEQRSSNLNLLSLWL